MTLNPPNTGMPSGKIRAVILDLDGTLIGPGERITPAVKDAMDRLSRRLPVAIATGREASDVARYALDLGLSSPQICDGGATILDPATHEHIWRRPLKPQNAQLVIARLQEMGSAFIATHLTASVRDYGRLPHWDLTRISALDLQEETADELAASFPGQSGGKSDGENGIQSVKVFLPYNGLWAVDFTRQGVDKALAAKQLARIWAISTLEMAAAGDSYNDLPLLHTCGWRIAMGNAAEEVKAIAHYVAPPVEEDGLAEAIDRYLLPRV
ncbi:MAG: hypothetical protein BZY80_06070 [SAR202 cluster bacterium Io17-Chloro-G2]|nr:MAG: hypothetical protein BZY80_06070 [SAR202 cluster bacterium Io17-Chloro-G2]